MFNQLVRKFGSFACLGAFSLLLATQPASAGEGGQGGDAIIDVQISCSPASIEVESLQRGSKAPKDLSNIVIVDQSGETRIEFDDNVRQFAIDPANYNAIETGR